MVVVSGDKDLLQLVNENTVMWDPMKDKIMDIAAVEEKYNVKPQQLLDCYALMGDSSDNVPGVPGIGPKTAEKLINQHQSLEGVYEALEGMKKSKMKERLAENKEKAFLSRDLIRLKYDAEVPVELAAYAFKEGDTEKLQDLFTRLGFKSMVEETVVTKPVPTEGFALVQTEESLLHLIEKLEKTALLVIDTETTSLDVSRATLVGISVCTDFESAWYIPVGHIQESGELQEGQLEQSLVLEALKPFLQSEALPKIGRASCRERVSSPV